MFSGVLTDRGITIETIAFDEGGELPAGGPRRSCSPAG